MGNETAAGANDFAPHDVLATFADMEAARRAVQAVQMAGVDASQISLYGPAADEAAADLDVVAADGRFAAVMWRRTWVGGIVGALAGAVLGGAIGALVLHEVWSDAIGVFWAAVVGTAVLGLGTGAATGATSSAQMSEAWELTFHTVGEGEVGVAIHTESDREAQRVVPILARHEPSTLERLDLPT
ncbi:MAG: hypothetical protein ACRDUY_06255 [Nitriliruptorales bacterium]